MKRIATSGEKCNHIAQFNYKGFSCKQLEDLCNPQNGNHGRAPWMFWTAELYSSGKYMRDYAHLPSFLPLNCYTDHGPGVYSRSIPPHELDNNAPVQFYQSPIKVRRFKKVSSKPCYCRLSPLVWCRKKNKIEQIANPCGTLAFAAHSTPSIDITTPYEEYIYELRQLDIRFYPICICMHMHDIHKGYHKIFLDNGFPVYTAGDNSDIRFGVRFYNILKNFQYSTSPVIGSYTYYSVEMGIPFFLFGRAPEFINKYDRNLSYGKYEFTSDSLYKAHVVLFNTPVSSVTTKQKKFIELHLGLHHCLSRKKMFIVLIGTLFKFSFFQFATKNIGNKLKRFIKQCMRLR